MSDHGLERAQSLTPEPQEEKTAEGQSFPEGGFRAWSVAAGAFCVLFCTFGYLNAYGYVCLCFINYYFKKGELHRTNALLCP